MIKLIGLLLLSIYNPVDTLVLDNHKYIIDSYVYRDHMPIVSLKSANKLHIVSHLVEITNKRIKEDIIIKALYLVQEQTIEVVPLIHGEQSVRDNSGVILTNYISPIKDNTYVHVVMKLEYEGMIYYLKDTCVYIETAY